MTIPQCPTCPTCGQSVNPDQAAVTSGEDGLIDAASLTAGLGPPLVGYGTCLDYLIYLDGIERTNVVAYDRINGLIWCHQMDSTDKPIIRNGAVAIEKLSGVVTIKRKDQAASSPAGS